MIAQGSAPLPVQRHIGLVVQLGDAGAQGVLGGGAETGPWSAAFARMYIARNIGAIKQTYSAVSETWNASTMGVAAVAASVATMTRAGLTARYASARAPSPIAPIPRPGWRR